MARPLTAVVERMARTASPSPRKARRPVCREAELASPGLVQTTTCRPAGTASIRAGQLSLVARDGESVLAGLKGTTIAPAFRTAWTCRVATELSEPTTPKTPGRGCEGVTGVLQARASRSAQPA